MAKKTATKKTAPAKKATAKKATAKKATASKATAPKQRTAPAAESAAKVEVVQTVDFNLFISKLRDLCDQFLKNAPAAVSGDTEGNAERRTELTAMAVAALRKLAVELGYDAAEVKNAAKGQLVDAILKVEAEGGTDDEDGEEDADEIEAEADDDSDDEGDDEADEEEDEEDEEDSEDAEEDSEEEDSEEEDEEEDEEGDEEDEEEDSEEFDRDELVKMSLKEIKALAKEQGFTPANYKGMDVDAIADLIIENADEDEEDDDEDEAYTEADYKKMSLAELKSLAKENSIKLPKGADKKAVIKVLLG